MKVLITGASGFVGQNLTSYLHDLDLKKVQREELNTLPPGLLNDIDTIIHLAGKAHDLKKTSNEDEYYQVNFELTVKLYDAFLQSNVRKFIFISSVKAVTDSVTGILGEDAACNPQTHYGKSKLMAEEYIKAQILPEGKSCYVLRPCMIHGPGNKGNLNLLYQFVKKNIPYPLAAFNNKRSFLSIGNLCFIIRELLLQSEIPSGVYHIADDEALSTNEIVAILAGNLGKTPKLWRIPKSLIYKIAALGDKFNLPLTSERLNKLTENYVISNEKLKKTLNVTLPISSKEGLKITVKSFN